MAYRNILGLFGHRWIGEHDREMILQDFPGDEFIVEVSFTDGKPDRLLELCDGKETSVDAIMIYYKDGTCTRDPSPFRWQVTGPVRWLDLRCPVGDSNPKTYFYNRSKDRKLFPQTRNEPEADTEAVRRTVRGKLANYLHMGGIENRPGFDIGPLRVPVNCFCGEARKNLLRYLESLDGDGVQTFVTIHIERATIDQLTRLDTEMEFGDLGEVLEIAEAAEKSHPAGE